MRYLKKICFFIPVHSSARMGGAEYQARLVLDALCNKDGYSIYYLCRRTAPDFIAQGYQIQKVGNNRETKKFERFFDAFRFYTALKNIRPQIIYQNVGCLYTGVGAYYAKKYGSKFIWHIASDDDVKPQWKKNLKRKLMTIPDRILLNYGIRNADIIAGQTQYQNSILKKRFKRKCDTYIPVGHPFPNEEIEKPGRVSVLWIANLKPLKQPEVFVRLAKALGNDCNASFVMIGRHGWGKWFAQLTEEIENMPNIEYVGELTQDQVNRYLDKSHILVNTSRYEGFSNTFVQAWLRRVPVVSLNVDPDNILVRKSIGFHSGTFTGLCRDVRVLVENKTLREEMGDRARCFARANHSAEIMVEKVIGLFN